MGEPAVHSYCTITINTLMINFWNLTKVYISRKRYSIKFNTCLRSFGMNKENVYGEPFFQFPSQNDPVEIYCEL